MKIIIAGSRKFTDYSLLKTKMDNLLQNVKTPITIISGCANGADTLGEMYAEENGYQILKFPAKWGDLSLKPCIVKYRSDGTSYNALAGHNRNAEMAKNADACVCFWDGKSSGTKNMIDLALKHKLNLRVIRI